MSLKQEFGQMFWLPLSYFLYWSPGSGPCQNKQKLLRADEFNGEKNNSNLKVTQSVLIFIHTPIVDFRDCPGLYISVLYEYIYFFMHVQVD